MRLRCRSLEEVHRNKALSRHAISRISLADVTPGWRSICQVSLLDFYSGVLLCFYDKYHDQKAAWRQKHLFGMYFHYWWESEQKFNVETWSRNHRGLLITGSRPLTYSAILRIQPRPIFLRAVLPTVVWAFLNHLAIKKMSHRHAYRPIWWWQFLN